VTALAAVVVVAAVDAVRGREADDPPAPATTELANRNAIADQLAALGARGELVLYGNGCAVQLLALPSLEQTQEQSGCEPRGAVSPDRSLVARCLGERTELFEQEASVLVQSLPGCAPAWRPDGVLTVAHERAVVRFLGTCPADETCVRTLIGKRELERAARRHPTVPETPVRVRVLVDGIAWLSQTRAAVLLSIRISGRLGGLGALSHIAFFENGRLATTAGYSRTTGGRLSASPRGTYLVQTPDVILRGNGTQVNLPPHLRGVQAFAWSADERLLALATRFAVVVLEVTSLERYDATGAGLRSVTLPLSVTELAWR
jgi:hypothetical protein